MKSLSLARPLIIMIIGLPGSGKSFFARQFADMFGAPLVSSDFVRHTISPDSLHTTEEDTVVNALILNELTQLLKTHRTIVMDGGVNNRPSRQAINRLAHKHDYGTLIIWVQTDEPTSLSRSTKRSSKRETDALNTALNVETFERLKRQFGTPTAIESESIIVISGKHTYTTQARVVLKKLVAPHGDVRAEPPIASSRPETETEQQPDVPPRRRVTIN